MVLKRSTLDMCMTCQRRVYEQNYQIITQTPKYVLKSIAFLCKLHPLGGTWSLAEFMITMYNGNAHNNDTILRSQRMKNVYTCVISALNC